LVNALPALRDGTVWADLNTASPQVKAALVERSAARDVPVVDVALLSPVPGRGLRTPMLASGEGAARYAEILAGLGIRVTIQPGTAGEASARKLLRSVFYKGLAAAVVEALAAAEAAGCAEWLRDNISAELAAADDQTIDRLVDGTHRHARRRAEEMRAAAEQVTALGIRTRIAAAAHDQLIDLRDRDTG
jgi:3-hydroxyisobutyrate dehydrogenase-like beta-hydroxyacid dehydrogenase